MARVQFVETVMIPGGPGRTLIPVEGVAATPYAINPDGTEGSQVSAFVDRTSMVQPDSLVTNASGTITFWLDSGDYNIHMDDQQSPPRIQSYVRGFTAPVIDANQLVVAAQNLIQYSGDTKFSLQNADHGLKADGTYEWLLVTSDADGGGRKLDPNQYAAIDDLLGNPTRDSQGMIRLPNISGRALIAAGKAAGLSTRNLLDLIGEENHMMNTNEMPNHNHSPANGRTGSGTTGISNTNKSITGVGLNDPGHAHSVRAGGDYEVPVTLGSWQGVGVASGTTYTQSPDPVSGVIVGQSSFATNGTGVSLSEPNAGQGHQHSVTDNGHDHSISLTSAGSNVPHNNIQPSACLNLFVKS